MVGEDVQIYLRTLVRVVVGIFRFKLMTVVLINYGKSTPRVVIAATGLVTI